MGLGGGKDEIRSSILLRGTCLKPPKTTGVYVGGQGSEKTSQFQELNQGGCDRLMEGRGLPHCSAIQNALIALKSGLVHLRNCVTLDKLFHLSRLQSP